MDPATNAFQPEKLRDEYDKEFPWYFPMVKDKLPKQERSVKDYFEIDSRIRELKSKHKKNIRARVKDPRLYSQIQNIDELISEDISERGSGFRIDKNALSIDE